MQSSILLGTKTSITGQKENPDHNPQFQCLDLKTPNHIQRFGDLHGHMDNKWLNCRETLHLRSVHNTLIHRISFSLREINNILHFFKLLTQFTNNFHQFFIGKLIHSALQSPPLHFGNFFLQLWRLKVSPLLPDFKR